MINQHVGIKHEISTHNTMIYVETQFGKKPLVTCYFVSHSSGVMSYERSTLLKATKDTVKYDLVKGFQPPC